MTPTPLRLVVVSAGASEPSSTQLLADRTAQRVSATASDHGHDVQLSVIPVRELLPEIPQALSSQLLGPRLTSAVDALTHADGVIAAAPVYKAGASAAFTALWQVLDNDLLIGKPVILAATAGTARHALVVDQEMRALFAYLRALPVPTGLFAAPEDFSSPSLSMRIDRAAKELVLLMESGFAAAVRQDTWHHYQHEFGSAGGTEVAVNVDSDLMHVAAGGSLKRPSP